MSQEVKLWRVFLKAGILFAIINFTFAAFPLNGDNSLSIYNTLVPGRARLPFGENPAQAYNLSLFDISAMSASHEIAGAPANEYRVILIGDSSIWGTLLPPEETLAGQLNTKNLKTADGRAIRIYNLGYPTISLTKDLLILEKAMQFEPDLIIWLTTLESFPADKQLSVPLVAHNSARVRALASAYNLNLDLSSDELIQPTFWDKTLIGRRRPIADWMRLQIYGLMWGITGIDQIYPESYEAAQIDLDADETFHDFAPPELPRDQMAFDLLDAGFRIVDETPLILINEPILISDGENSDLRYDYFYPRWAYDQYREILQEKSAKNNWAYYDFWDIIPPNEFTNSAVHLTSAGVSILADEVEKLFLDVH